MGDLASKYVEANGRLMIANGRTSDVIAIMEACDRHQKEVAKALQPKPFWRFGN